MPKTTNGETVLTGPISANNNEDTIKGTYSNLLNMKTGNKILHKQYKKNSEYDSLGVFMDALTNPYQTPNACLPATIA